MLWNHTEEPEVDAEVAVLPWEDAKESRQARTGETGEATLEYPQSWSAPWLVVSAPGAETVSQALAFEIGAPLTIRLKSRFRIEGEITDASSGEGIPAAEIECCEDPWIADSSGRYSIPRDAPGSVQPSVSAAAHVRRHHTVYATGEGATQLDVSLPPTEPVGSFQLTKIYAGNYDVAIYAWKKEQTVSLGTRYPQHPGTVNWTVPASP